jgi:hypothetical protein
MADDNALELLKRGDKRFAKRASLESFWQEVMLNFMPWHASFGTELMWGEDFAAHLTDNSPGLLARDFVGQIGAMLRPPGKQWMWHRSSREEVNDDSESREYLDWRSKQMMRIMTDRVTGFHGACKTDDEFFGMIGNSVLSVDLNAKRDSLRFSAYHVKDVVWAIGAENKPDILTRKEMVPARVVMQRFRLPGDKLHAKVKEVYDKDPDAEIEIRHEVLPCEDYDAYNKKTPGFGKYCSVWIDVSNKHVMRETKQQTLRYVVSGWVRMPGSPYAISPATTIALPDARLIQQQAIAILEAAEKQVNPPLIAAADAIRGDIRLDSLGVTWVDRSYDERSGEPLRALELGKNFQLGVDALLRTENQLTRAFYLDTLRMPDTRSSRSVEEVQFKIDEYVRAALPLFAPMQTEKNEAMLFEVDQLVALTGGYEGRTPPKQLKESEIIFAWDNPLSDMLERQKAQRLGELSQLAQTSAALEAAAMQAPALKQINVGKAFREAAIGIGSAGWLYTEEESVAEELKLHEANSEQAMVAAAPNIAQVIDSGVNAAQVATTIPNQGEPGFALPMPA